MNYLDIIILIIVAFFVIRGFMKGLILSLTSLAGFALGIYVSFKFGSRGADLLGELFHADHKYLYLISVILIFLIINLLAYIVGKMLENMAGAASLGCLNKVAGAFLGLAKAILFTALFIFLVNLMDPNEKVITLQHKKESSVYRQVEDAFTKYLPKIELKEKIKEQNII